MIKILGRRTRFKTKLGKGNKEESSLLFVDRTTNLGPSEDYRRSAGREIRVGVRKNVQRETGVERVGVGGRVVGCSSKKSREIIK